MTSTPIPTPRRTPRREKGSGSARQLPNGRWQAVLELTPDPATGERRRVSATGRTKAEALARVKERKRDAERDAAVYNGRRAPRLGEWLETWLKDYVTPRRKPLTVATYGTAIRLHIRPAIGAVRIDRLTPAHFRLLEERMLHGDPKTGALPHKASTARLVFGVLRAGLEEAVRAGLVDRNPADRALAPAAPARDIAILTPAQAGRLIRMEPDPTWHLVWRLAFATGMRLGEILGMTGSEVVRQDGVTCLDVKWQLKQWPSTVSEETLPADVEARHLSGGAWLTRPKTKAGRRLVPLPADLARELAGYIASKGGVGPDDLILSHPDGRPIRPDSQQKAWARALERAGLPHVRFHSARHTAATAMVRMGIGDAVREAIIGHSDIAVTNEVYTHVDTQMALKAVEGIEAQVVEPVKEEESNETV